MLAQLALVFVYLSVLLVKSCDISVSTCENFGFGKTAKGIYLFFIFFGVRAVTTEVM